MFLFGIQINSTTLAVTCYARVGIYRVLSDLQYLIFYALGPPPLMLLFGLLTLNNLRKNRRLVQPDSHRTNQSTSNTSKKRDTQLLVMLLFQILIIIGFTLPFAIQKLVDTFVSRVEQTAVEKAQYSLLTGTLRLLSYGSHTLGFFFYTLAARIFRLELIRIVNKLFRFFIRRSLFRSTRPVVSQGTTNIRHDIHVSQLTNN
jgi:hypothetical protein